jgi:hypothetical protein
MTRWDRVEEFKQSDINIMICLNALHKILILITQHTHQLEHSTDRRDDRTVGQEHYDSQPRCAPVLKII